jgi:pimeloyl-ACP methyl ester carboxylesterase
VYALTLRGHGRSDHPAQGYGRGDFAADVLAFLEQFGIRHATLVGHSLGSFVAQDVAREAGDRVGGLVLVGASAGPPRDPETRRAIQHDFAAVSDPIPYAFARDFQIGTVYGPVAPGFLETMVGEAGRVSAATWHALADTLTAQDAYHDPSGIRVPAWIVWGSRDLIFGRAEQQDLEQKIAGARLSIYPETGHAVHWEQPQRFAHELVGFIGATSR